MFESPLGLVAAENSSSGGAAIFQLLFFGLIFVAMYFLLIRPQRRRSRWLEIAENVEVRVMRSSISRRVNASTVAGSAESAANDEK